MLDYLVKQRANWYNYQLALCYFILYICCNKENNLSNESERLFEICICVTNNHAEHGIIQMGK